MRAYETWVGCVEGEVAGGSCRKTDVDRTKKLCQKSTEKMTERFKQIASQKESKFGNMETVRLKKEKCPN